MVVVDVDGRSRIRDVSGKVGTSVGETVCANVVRLVGLGGRHRAVVVLGRQVLGLDVVVRLGDGRVGDGREGLMVTRSIVAFIAFELPESAGIEYDN